MPSPPRTMNGEIIVTTMASYHAKKKQIKLEIVMPRNASTNIPIASVVKPLTALTSSVIILVSTPGALSLLSNQPICLDRIASNNLIRRRKVRLSPPYPKQIFYVNVLRPIPITRPTKAKVQMLRCLSNSARSSSLSRGRSSTNTY